MKTLLIILIIGIFTLGIVSAGILDIFFKEKEKSSLEIMNVTDIDFDYKVDLLDTTKLKESEYLSKEKEKEKLILDSKEITKDISSSNLIYENRGGLIRIKNG
jgi:hypothetical protein